MFDASLGREIAAYRKPYRHELAPCGPGTSPALLSDASRSIIYFVERNKVMANFQQPSTSVAANGKTIVTLFGGGPAPENKPLDVVPDKPTLLTVARISSRPGPLYDWELTGKLPGKVRLRNHPEITCPFFDVQFLQ